MGAMKNLRILVLALNFFWYTVSIANVRIDAAQVLAGILGIVLSDV